VITTHVHTVSSSTTAYTTAGVDVFEAGPTNFNISFSGANTNATYLKFFVNYPNDDKVYTITAPTDDVDSIRIQSISKTFYPEHAEYLTTYTIDVSGLKNDLTTDLYKINLKLGRDVLSKYGNIKVVGSHLYTNDEGSNYCLLTLENDEPRFISNVIVPFNKSSAVYVPDIPSPFAPNDNRILRTEMLSPNGGQVPICVEVIYQEIIGENQYQELAIGSENAYHQLHAVFYHHNNGIPNRIFDPKTGATAGMVARGDTVDDYLIYAPEDGIDYSIFLEDQQGGIYDDDYVINVTITEIYPDGIAS